MTNWRTPKALFDLIQQAAGGEFLIDAAADESNHLCPSWYGPGSALAEDALSVVHWDSPAFCNPPYTRDILGWCEKFAEQQRRGNTVIALLPAKTGTNWWAQGVVPFADIIFLTGRVPFEMECEGCGGYGVRGNTAYVIGEDPGLFPPLQDEPCKVCKGIGHPPSSPNHDSALCAYGPNTGGKVRWIDWKGRVEAIKEGEVIDEPDEPVDAE